MTDVFVPALGHTVRLVPRKQLLLSPEVREIIPAPICDEVMAAPPASFDGSKGRKTNYPILGNDQYGDCYLADALHCVQTWTGWFGPEAEFDVPAVVALYKQLSGGDNGLNDNQIFGAWKKGLFGHRILDVLKVNPQDDNQIRIALSRYCGASWTCSLPDAWIQSAAPGAVWDRGVPNPQNGHAMHLSGYSSQYYFDETWGIDPPIRLTPAGLKSADPEVTVQFSLDMFDPVTHLSFDGLTYEAKAAQWKADGGATLPPNPFPGPGPGPGPNPPPPRILTKEMWDDEFAILIAAARPRDRATLRKVQALGDRDLSGSGADGPLANVDWFALMVDVMALFVAYRAHDVPGMIADALKLLADLGVKAP